jgi:hypothetical protein
MSEYKNFLNDKLEDLNEGLSASASRRIKHNNGRVGEVAFNKNGKEIKNSVVLEATDTKSIIAQLSGKALILMSDDMKSANSEEIYIPNAKLLKKLI